MSQPQHATIRTLSGVTFDYLDPGVVCLDLEGEPCPRCGAL